MSRRRASEKGVLQHDVRASSGTHGGLRGIERCLYAQRGRLHLWRKKWQKAQGFLKHMSENGDDLISLNQDGSVQVL